MSDELSCGLVSTAQYLLEQERHDQAALCLQAALRLKPGHLTAHNLLESHNLPGALGRAFRLEGRIHPDDDIFRFFSNHPTSINPVRDYLSDGWRTLAELRSLLERFHVRLDTCPAFLEFACGHGRFTRHLVKALPEGALTVAELVPGAVEFLQDTMGVQGFNSCAVPEDLAVTQRFKVIFVLSLFSHLPDGLWQRWLDKLLELTAPGGMLIFTTHGLHCAQQAGITLDEQGYFFVADSESAQVDSSLYGTSFTSPEFVRRAISELESAQSLEVAHVPEHFWANQDAWVLIKH